VTVGGRAVLLPEADIDTDVLYPGARMNVSDPEEMKQYLFEGYDPAIRDLLGGDVVLVTGPNFGIGSSREHVPQAMQAWGVRLVLGHSFARIFKRNCINLGLPVAESAEAVAAATAGVEIAADLERGEVRVGEATFAARGVSPFVAELVRLGGLGAWLRREVAIQEGLA
jgi:3-isopropylmalate/(R)-2-methylmalate dehydratase small subunit